MRFLQEAAIMGQFCHPNVVRLYGVVTVGDPVSHSCPNKEWNELELQHTVMPIHFALTNLV